MEFAYQLKVQPVEIPAPRDGLAALRLEIECLENLDQTIDGLFAALEKTGDARLLEELCPYFGVVWPSARILAEKVFSLGADALAGRDVLELGCGLAIPSLVAARLGARVTATDFHPEVPVFLERNLVRNAIQGLRYLRIDWQDIAAAGQFDLVIASDVLYEKEHPARLARTVTETLRPGGRVFLADPARPYLQAFVDEMGRRGFRHELTVRTEIFLFEFRR